jgi:hypothetical protein
VINSLLDGSFNLENKDVKALCSRQVYERGLTYFRGGRVSNTQVHGMILRGDVQGNESRSYRIKIEYDSGRLIPKCTCPFDQVHQVLIIKSEPLMYVREYRLITIPFSAMLHDSLRVLVYAYS